MKVWREKARATVVGCERTGLSGLWQRRFGNYR